MKHLLKEKVAIVTGGTAGIGKAIALKFVEEGAKVVILGTRPENGQTAVEEIKQAVPDGMIQFYAADVSKTAETDQVFQQILKDFGQIDILVNNAGITADQLLMRMNEEDWDRVINVNLKSCYNTCHAIVRHMMKRGGKIINITSVVGLMGNIGQVNYAASKAGMIGLTKALAKELASRKVLVNAIAPGFIQTKMTEGLVDAQKEALIKSIPLGRFGQPEEIANMAWFLASPLSDYITGQILTVDGGMVI
ncbi:MAG: 3-oxoacyl-[acyl-carrier-protein] reductase [Parachlamydiaceae bacterium]|nr:3-oxoacyl-[acyl-carrier-protein] reductase [Parachlamydiaceae bacterium]